MRGILNVTDVASALGSPSAARVILAAALIGFEHQRSEIEEKIAELRRQIDGRVAEPAPERGRMSAGGRQRIAAAQRKRWAALKKGRVATKAAPKKAAGRKRTMSAGARKRIGEATKKRWAAFRAKKAGTAS